jgi:hypothetical protein
MSIWTKDREFPEKSIPFLHKPTNIISMSSLVILSLKFSSFVPKTLNVLLLIAIFFAAYILFLGTKDENLNAYLE